jgi:hypothetical protein
MNVTSPDGKFFERWFALLAKYKFVAALLPLAGIAIGSFLAMSGHVMPEPFSWYISLIGTIMIGIGAFLFLFVAVVFVVNWTKNP